MAGPTPWLIVPTRGDHPDLLAGIVSDCGLPADRIVVVATRTGLDIPPGVHVRHDLAAATNIQRWWNEGIRCARRGGATHVLVCNDDIALAPGTVPVMLEELHRTGAALCWAHPTAMTGWCWLLDLASGVRPDETFRWWLGDDDLAAQCEAAGRPSAGVEAGVRHLHGNETTEASPALQALAAADHLAFREKWGAT